MPTDAAFSELRPLAMGELIDRSARFWRSHLKSLFQLYLGFHLVLYILVKAFTLALTSYFPLVQGGAALASAMLNNSAEVARQFLLAGAAAVPVFALYFAVAWFAAVACARYVVRAYLGEQVSTLEAVRFLLHRLVRATAVFALCTAVSISVVLAVLLPAAFGLFAASLLARAALLETRGVLSVAIISLAAFAATLALLCFALWYLLRFLLVAPVAAAEDLGVRATLKRSAQLVSGRIGPGFLDRVRVRAGLLTAILGLVLLAVSSLGSIPALAVTVLYGNPWDPARANPSAIPQLLLVPAELFNVAVQSLFSPLSVILASLLYIDMRVRREGLDLQLKLQRPPPRAA